MSVLNKNDQNGRSMVEMLGVLAIIGVLSVGGISGYSKAMAKFKLTKAQDQISMLLMNIRTAFATSPSTCHRQPPFLPSLSTLTSVPWSWHAFVLHCEDPLVHD